MEITPEMARRVLMLPADTRVQPVMTLAAAAELLGMSRPAAYQARRRGSFPVPVLARGSRYSVRTADLVRYLLAAPAAA